MKNKKSWLVASSKTGHEGKEDVKVVSESLPERALFVAGRNCWVMDSPKGEDQWLVFDFKEARRISSFVYSTMANMTAPRMMALLHTGNLNQLQPYPIVNPKPRN